MDLIEIPKEKGLLELQIRNKGLYPIGIDEVGRGCLAGPVYAAAVKLNYQKLDQLDLKTKALIRDSKKLSSKQRQAISPVILSICEAHTISQASVREIETLGIVGATFTAMARAYQDLRSDTDLVLIDGNQKNSLIKQDQICVVGGDGLCFAIAAASILAKEARDSFMREVSMAYPSYEFQDNVGYGTKSHLNALAKHGITPLHRRNFAPISRMISEANTF